MENIAVVVLDLDGTALRSDKTLAEATTRQIAAWRAGGGTLIVATARPGRAVWPLLPDDWRNGWVVLCNGSQIWHRGRLVWREDIAEASVRALAAAFRSRFPGAPFGFERDDRLYAVASFAAHWLSVPDEVVAPEALPYGPTSKVLVDLAEPEQLAVVQDALPRDCRLIVTDGGRLAQILPGNAGKARAVGWILERIHRTWSETLCFGDDCNDADLFRACRQSVAMANAVPELQVLGTHRTASNDDDGVARFLAAHLGGRTDSPAPR